MAGRANAGGPRHRPAVLRHPAGARPRGQARRRAGGRNAGGREGGGGEHPALGPRLRVGGLGAAHSVHNGLTALEGTHDYWHGEKVAFGLITMLVLEERPAEVLEEVVDFCLMVGLPVSLEDIGVENASREEIEGVAEAACAEGETIHNMPIEIQPAMLVDAMIAADAFGRQRRAALEGEASLPAVAN